MKIQLQEIPVRDLVEGYFNDVEEGVVGYNGKLNIRPAYQREFIYNDKQQKAVIDTVKKDFPLNVMYWVKNKDGSLEVLDGQQRSISICDYIIGNYNINHQFFYNLTQEEKDQILDYKLMVYLCEGTEKEKLDWFKTINIASVKLTDQELRNAIYTGPWLSDAKLFFSKRNCPAYQIASKYLKGQSIKQEYLETVLKWISNDNIDDYMSKHQLDPSAFEIKSYFKSVFQWVEDVFPEYRKEMKGVDFGYLYNEFHKQPLDANKIEAKIKELIMDDDVTNLKGIYSYVLDGKEKHLSIRAFSIKQKREAYERQGGICPRCKAPDNHYEFNEMEGDHITPWVEGGKTNADNCQMLCRFHNREKSSK